MKEALFVMLSGALGSLCRYGVGRGTKFVFTGSFPLDTLIVNVFGCLLFGFMAQMVSAGIQMPKHVQVAVTIGFLGAFTTFSTFGFATFDFIRQGAFGQATLNIFANLLLGIFAAWLGMNGARMLSAAS